MGRLSTHVLDLVNGKPAGGVRIELFALERDGPRRITQAVTNADGRTDAPLMAGDGYRPGSYELVFHAGDYFAGAGVALPSPRFLDRVPVRFGVAAADQHYHVPLLLAPYGYSTYRGS